jgi:hypothetical protein
LEVLIEIEIRIRPQYLKAFLKGEKVPAASNTVHNDDAIGLILDIKEVTVEVVEDGPFPGEVFFTFTPPASKEAHKEAGRPALKKEKESQKKVS